MTTHSSLVCISSNLAFDSGSHIDEIKLQLKTDEQYEPFQYVQYKALLAPHVQLLP